MKTKLDLEISDLFFNHEHPAHSNLFGEKKPYPNHEQQHAALVEDAQDFAKTLTRLAGYEITPTDCADDFLDRQ